MPEREVGQAVGKSGQARQCFIAPQIRFPLQPSGREFALDFCSTLALSSSRILKNSTRHSVTSRIERNSRTLSDLFFSTRHLNATPEKTPTCSKIQHLPSPFQRFRFVRRYEAPLRNHCCVTKTRTREPRPGSREPLRFLCYPRAFAADETSARRYTYHVPAFQEGMARFHSDLLFSRDANGCQMPTGNSTGGTQK